MASRFGPAVRLHTRKEFTAVQEGGRRVGARHMTVLGRPNGLGYDRLGLVASRRLGGAVVRNRAKRRLREVFKRQMAESLPAGTSAGWDVVVIGRPGVNDAPFPALVVEFTAAIRRLRGPRSSVS